MAKFWRKTGDSVNIDETFDPGASFQLEEVRVHLSGDGTDNDFTVTLVSNASSSDDEYDTVLFSQGMSGVTDIVHQPDRPLQFEKGDKLDIDWDKGADVVWGVEIVYNLTGF